jgi:menaquinone-dependent protoporphyrinogen oxidase
MSGQHTYLYHVCEDAGSLVIYASTHGHTAKIATRIVEAMRVEGCEVDLRDVKDAGDARPGRYDLVVGASVHKSQHQKEIVAWVRERRDVLAQLPSILFSVSLSASGDTAASRAATQPCIDEFCAKTGWVPTGSVTEVVERARGELRARRRKRHDGGSASRA